MPNIADVNGEYVPLEYAVTSIQDRGYQFADSAYEVITVINNKYIDIDRHLNRLKRTLSEMRINMPISDNALKIRIQNVIEMNKTKNALIYIQISRGIAKRKHSIPKDITPVIVITCNRLKYDMMNKETEPLKLKTIKDQRHKRCDLKTTALLPNILALEDAKENGYDDALMIDEEGFITEGTSWNFWIVDKDGIIKTRYLDDYILHGITRHAIIETVKRMEKKVIESVITKKEISNAKEAFVTSASRFIQPVSSIDDMNLPKERPISDKLRQEYFRYFTLN